jgi:hypothetical protein
MLPEEKYWNDLLPALWRGEVVPVIGPGTLWSSETDAGMLLQDQVVKIAAETLGIAYQTGMDIEKLAAEFIRSNRENSADEVHGIIEAALAEHRRNSGGEIDLPLLRKLAELPFDLWITTTVDGLAQDVLGLGDESVGFYSPASSRDLPTESGNASKMLFHLFGRLQDGPGRAAFLEIDLIEYMWSLREDLASKLPQLESRLDKSRLLFLGNAHPDWLARFFLRLTRKQAFGFTHGQMKGKREFVVDPLALADDRLAAFISLYHQQGVIVQMSDLRKFIPELLLRWRNFEQAQRKRVGTPAGRDHPPNPPGVIEDGQYAVFISYSSRDRAAAESLENRLKEKGLTCWFDKHRQCDDLAGTEWWPVIESRIHACDLFVAVVSKNSVEERDEGVYIKEWKTAVDKNRRVNTSIRRYLWMLVVDETEGKDVKYPGMNGMNINRAPGGCPEENLLETMKQEVRARRRRGGKEIA